ncbi:glycosyltransferase family 1 protein [Hypoxylon sp. CI-4A]|nr:glycosyltransferase family 1 protein [Hypoxylon sp. CI-4A]
MLGRIVLGSSVLIAALGFLLQWLLPPWAPATPFVPGRNNTVLFISNTEFGLSNIFVSTVYALLERHPDVQVHYASYAEMAPRLERVAKHVRQTNPSARDAILHRFPDRLTFIDAMITGGRTVDVIRSPPGLAGIDNLCRDMPFYTAPWTADKHIALYQETIDIIDEVDPALVVLDIFFRPPIEAARQTKRLHAFLTPNPPVDTFVLEQPYLSWLWKYPVMASGIPFPVPWSKLPLNIYLNLRYFYNMLFMPGLQETLRALKSKGLNHQISLFDLHRSNTPWFTTSLPGASTPLDYYPPNVTEVGPMMLSLSTVEEENPALAEWLARRPTVLVNLGSVFSWGESQATVMARALADFRKAPLDAEGATYGDEEFAAPIQKYIDEGRIKMEAWLAVEPTSLLETGHFIASVHHGGSGSYNEALGTGVAHVALPQWTDHYSFAQLTENIGVGVWGCRETSPDWTPDCLHDALSTVIGSGEASIAIREKAKHFGEIARKDPGQYVVAREVAGLAASGY